MRKDITGQKFGKLLVLEYIKTINKRPYWKCLCDCGNIVEKRGKELKSKLVKSCGCLLKERGPDKDLTGKKFNYLTVIKCIGKKTRRNEYWWECKCDCGSITKSSSNKIISGRKKSCGCLLKQKSRERAIQRNKNQFGENNSNWRKDLTNDERQIKKNERKTFAPKLKRWIKKVYDRDRYKCVKCGFLNKRLSAHHIYSWHSHKKLRYTLNNGITLCKGCHEDFHHKFGYKNNTKKQFKEWLLI